MKVQRPPRDDLFRGLLPLTFTPRSQRDSGGFDPPILSGYFSRYGDWTTISSIFEGNFLERFDSRAFAKTIKENSPNMRVLFQHGFDPQAGDKPLGPIRLLEDRAEGPYYEVPLLDTAYNRDILPGLEAGLYGASHRFRVMREEWVDEPERSDYNPNGLPERTIKEAQVMEFGPVTFPALASATAGVRSLTDYFLVDKLAADPERLKQLIEARQARLEGGDPTLRMDSEDVGCLAQMLTLASQYIEEQDEGDDEANVPAMQAVQASLIQLLNVEAAEDEPDDDEYNSAPSEEGSTRDSERREQDTSDAPADATRKARKNYLSNGKETPSWLL